MSEAEIHSVQSKPVIASNLGVHVPNLPNVTVSKLCDFKGFAAGVTASFWKTSIISFGSSLRDSTAVRVASAEGWGIGMQRWREQYLGRMELLPAMSTAEVDHFLR